MAGFEEFFGDAVGKVAFETHEGQPTRIVPYKYQEELAARDTPPTILNVPTGCGKTAAAVLSWLWRRRTEATKERTPRRLVYCLPMRTLVDQVKESVDKWLGNLGLDGKVDVAVLMGGNADRDWMHNPDRDAILIGTQDMLLSRAMNRGYGLPPSAWPIAFGLLNNDCFWVIDEVQLMDNGVPTSVQLDSLRRRIGTYGKCKTMWMSATVKATELVTPDFEKGDHDTYSPADPNPRITKAKKVLQMLQGVVSRGNSYADSDAKKIFGYHMEGTTTLIIVNRVGRAQSLYLSIKKLAGDKTKVILVHSRFRPAERHGINRVLESEVGKLGRDIIVVSTQAIEAGVDISSCTLITELAPVTSMVQRFGRCNRRAEHESGARVCWIDVDSSDAAPYAPADLEEAREWLSGRSSASSGDLDYPAAARLHDAVLRRPDLYALFDTAPDLSGTYLDVSRFVRHGDAETDVLVYWRNVPKGGRPDKEMARHARDEVCSVPIGDFKKFVAAHKFSVWHYDHMGEEYSDSPWVRASAPDVRPGQAFLVETDSGGYSNELGWYPAEGKTSETARQKKGMTATTRSWVKLDVHSKNVRSKAEKIVGKISILDERAKASVLAAALFHDVGKSHHVFQNTLTAGYDNRKGDLWAKSPGRGRTHERKNFRHEVASALAYLEQHGSERNSALVAYLIAAHHGKVRMSLRTTASRKEGPPDGRYLLGFSTDPDKPDEIPGSRLGDGTNFPPTKIRMDAASLGSPGGRRPSWLSMSSGLRDEADLGPFKLAYLESMVRAADVQASMEEEEVG